MSEGSDRARECVSRAVYLHHHETYYAFRVVLFGLILPTSLVMQEENAWDLDSLAYAYVLETMPVRVDCH